ncbi:MAG: hypothetical protein ACI9MR_004183 [Myxococcota bacterium]|jgi:hypothetical protein
MKLTAICGLATMLLLSGPQAMSAPSQLAYQGALTMEDGAPFVGDIALEIALYDSADATVAVWGPVLFDPLPVIDGRLDLVLGAGSQPLLTDAIAADCAFVEVTIDGVTLTPRQALTAAPYALRASDADLLAGVSIDALVMRSEMQAYVEVADLGAVAFSNSYDDLVDKPQLLQGPKGDTGDTGIQGEPGLRGDTGIQGMIGAKGDTGDPGDLSGYVQQGEADSVSTDMILDGAVTADKLADGCALGQQLVRTVAGRTCEDPAYVNVKWFGAVADLTLPSGARNLNPTDDTAAIQAAIDHAVTGYDGNIRPVYIPAGGYYIAGTLEINYKVVNSAGAPHGHIRIFGDGGNTVEPLFARGTVLFKDTPGAIMRMNERADGQRPDGDANTQQVLKYIDAIHLDGIAFQGPVVGGNAVPAVDGFVGRGINRSTFQNLGFLWLNHGIRNGHVSGQVIFSNGVDLDYGERNTFRALSMRRVHRMFHLLGPDITLIEQCFLSRGINRNSLIAYIAGGNDFVTFRSNIVHPYFNDHMGALPHPSLATAFEFFFTNGIRFIGNHVEGLASDGQLFVGSLRWLEVQNNLISPIEGADPPSSFVTLAFLDAQSGLRFQGNMVRLTKPDGPFFNLSVLGDTNFSLLSQLTAIDTTPNSVRDLTGERWELTTNTGGLGNLKGLWRQPYRFGDNYVWVRQHPSGDSLYMNRVAPVHDANGSLVGEQNLLNRTTTLPETNLAAGEYVAHDVSYSSCTPVSRVTANPDYTGTPEDLMVTARCVAGKFKLQLFNPTADAMTIPSGTWHLAISR